MSKLPAQVCPRANGNGKPTYEEWCADLLLVASDVYCFYFTENGKPKPMVKRKRMRPDGTGHYGPGKQEAGDDKYRELEKEMLEAAWQGRLCFGPRLPARSKTTEWGDLTTHYFCLDCDAHDNRIQRSRAENFAKGTYDLLAKEFLAPRYTTVSSTDRDGLCGGVHVVWLTEQHLRLPHAAELADHAARLLVSLAGEYGISVIECAPRAAEKNFTLGGVNVKGLPGFIRWPRTAHNSQPRGSEIVSFGTFLEVGDTERALGDLQDKPHGDEGRINTSLSKPAVRASAGFSRDLNSGDSRDSRDSRCTASWRASHLAYWRDWVFEMGQANYAIQRMAGALAGIHGALEEEAREITTEIIELAVEEGRYHCRRPSEQFIDDTLVCYRYLREVDPEGFGVRNDLEFFEGEGKYLAQIEDADEKHFAYAAMVAGKLAERDDRTHFPWPSAKVVAYMDQGSGREYQGYQRFRYLVNHKYNPKSNSKNGQLFLTDRIVAVGRKATQYRLDVSNLGWGTLISQTEIERKHGLLPLTSELWSRLDSPRTPYP